jgi:hypothetical protein
MKIYGAGMKFTLVGVVLILFLCSRSNAQNINPFAGDKRMEQKLTLSFHDKSMLNFLADLEQQTNIPFFADQSLMQNCLTLSVNNRTLGDILKEIASFFHLSWQREGKPGAYSYRLFQSPEQMKEQSEAVVKQSALLKRSNFDLLLDELKAFRQVDSVPDDSLRTKLNQLVHQKMSAASPDTAQELDNEIAVIRNMLEHTPAARFVYRYLLTFAPNELRTIFEGQKRISVIRFSQNQQGGIPISVFKGYPFWEPSTTVQGAPVINAPEHALTFAGISLNANREGPPHIEWMVTLEYTDFASYMPYAQVDNLPTITQQSAASTLFPLSPSDWKSQPGLNTKIGVQPSSKTSISLGTELINLCSANSPDLIADSFWKARVYPLEEASLSIGDALNQLCIATGHHWNIHDGFVEVQSDIYALNELREPPAESVARWEELDHTEKWDIDTFADMCALPDPQYETLKQIIRDWPIVPHMAVLDTVRKPLIFWKLLNVHQQNMAKENGLPYSDLTPAQKELFNEIWSDRQQPIQPDDQSLKDANFTLSKTATRGWGYRKNSLMHYWGDASRKDAWSSLRFANPQITENDLHPYREVTVSMLFNTPSASPAGFQFIYYQIRDNPDQD